MKVTVNNEQKKNVKVTYPRLLEYKSQGSVFLQLADNIAVCLVKGNETEWNEGEYCTIFDPGSCTPFLGSITLSND